MMSLPLLCSPFSPPFTCPSFGALLVQCHPSHLALFCLPSKICFPAHKKILKSKPVIESVFPCVFLPYLPFANLSNLLQGFLSDFCQSFVPSPCSISSLPSTMALPQRFYFPPSPLVPSWRLCFFQCGAEANPFPIPFFFSKRLISSLLVPTTIPFPYPFALCHRLLSVS